MWLTAPGGSLDFLVASKSAHPACLRPVRSLLRFGAGRLCSGSGRHQIGEPRARGLVNTVTPPGGTAGSAEAENTDDGADARDYLVSSPVSALPPPWGFTDGEMAAGIRTR
jgi:hypothetical protein